MKNEQQIWNLKREVNSPKSRLIDIMRDLRELAPRKARSLENIIARLEEWQNSR